MLTFQWDTHVVRANHRRRKLRNNMVRSCHLAVPSRPLMMTCFPALTMNIDSDSESQLCNRHQSPSDRNMHHVRDFWGGRRTNTETQSELRGVSNSCRTVYIVPIVVWNESLARKNCWYLKIFRSLKFNRHQQRPIHSVCMRAMHNSCRNGMFWKESANYIQITPERDHHISGCRCIRRLRCAWNANALFWAQSWNFYSEHGGSWRNLDVMSCTHVPLLPLCNVSVCLKDRTFRRNNWRIRSKGMMIFLPAAEPSGLWIVIHVLVLTILKIIHDQAPSCSK